MQFSRLSLSDCKIWCRTIRYALYAELIYQSKKLSFSQALCNSRIDSLDRQKITAALKDLEFICDQRWSGELKSLIDDLSSKIDMRPVINRDLGINCGFSRIMPFPKKNLTDETIDLKPNVVRGSYEGDEEYLRVQRNLLEEDYVRPLRDDLRRFLAGRTSDLDNVYNYGVGEIIERRPTRTGDVEVMVHLDETVLNFRSVDWETSSRLTFGSLVMLMDGANPILFTVSQRDPEQLKEGLVTLKLLDINDAEHCQIRKHYPMLESRAYFEAYRPVVQVLQKMSSVPFSKYLVDVETNAVTVPDYLNSIDGVLVDISALQKKPTRRMKQVLDSSDVYRALMQPSDVCDPRKRVQIPLQDVLNSSKFETCLNQSQLEAFRSCLRQEFALIQGPPGTGKSFVGKAILSFLIDNRSLWKKKRPILVVCYTNQGCLMLLLCTYLLANQTQSFMTYL